MEEQTPKKIENVLAYSLCCFDTSLLHSRDCIWSHFHTCGWKSDQSVRCWGKFFSDTNPVVSIPSGPFIQISAGWDYTCGVRPNYTAVCWGNKASAKFNFTAPSTEFKSITAGRYHACGLDLQGNVTCFGATQVANHGQINSPDGSFTQLSIGDLHTCGLTTSNRIVCWGDNSRNQLKVIGSNFIQVAAGGYFSCGLTSLSKIVCWGENVYGQLFIDNSYQYSQVSAGYGVVCGLSNKQILCYGMNDVGPREAPSGLFTDIALGNYHGCAILNSDSSIIYRGSNNYAQVSPVSQCTCPFQCINNSNGACIADGVCTCNENYDASTYCSSCLTGYSGANCTSDSCFGVIPTSSDVCSGNGECVDLDTCACNS